MTKLVVTIDLDNAAFQDNPDELRVQLANIGREYEHGIRDNPVRDSNGNTCGSWEMREYVELTPDEVLSVKSALAWRGWSPAQQLVTGHEFNDGRAGQYDDRKVRVLAEVRS